MTKLKDPDVVLRHVCDFLTDPDRADLRDALERVQALELHHREGGFVPRIPHNLERAAAHSTHEIAFALGRLAGTVDAPKATRPSITSALGGLRIAIQDALDAAEARLENPLGAFTDEHGRRHTRPGQSGPG